MTGDSPELTVTIELGARSRRLPLLALAAALRFPREPLRHILAGLVLSTPSGITTVEAPGEPTEEIPIDRSVGAFQQELKGARTIVRREGERGEGSADVAPQAEAIARALEDEANLPAIRRVVATAPAHAVQAALSETLSVSAERIRNRGAYFTAAVRRRQRPPSATNPSAPPYA